MSVDINKEIQRLIHLDLTGDLTAEEAKALEAWSNESEQNRRFLHNIRQEWIVDEARQFHSIDTTAAWEKIRQQTFAKTSMPRIRKQINHKKHQIKLTLTKYHSNPHTPSICNKQRFISTPPE